jgi:hypothetical protein
MRIRNSQRPLWRYVPVNAQPSKKLETWSPALNTFSTYYAAHQIHYVNDSLSQSPHSLLGYQASGYPQKWWDNLKMKRASKSLSFVNIAI